MSSALAKLNPFQTARRQPDTVGDLVSAFESDTVAVFMRTAPGNEHVMLYVLAAILIIVLALASIVKLDRVVTSVGRVVPSAGSFYMSPFDTGIVRQVLVRQGEVVKKGQALASLDPTFTRADLLQIQQKLGSDEAVVGRLEAELSGQRYHIDPSNGFQLLQSGIWEKRQAEYHSNLADFDARIHNAEAQVVQYAADAHHYEDRLRLARNVESLYKPLLEKGYVSKLQEIQSQDERTEVTRLLGDAQNQMNALQQTSASVRAQREAFVQKWHSDIGIELVTTRNDLNATRQSLGKAQKLAELATLNAPADAIVLNIGRISTGSVAAGGAQAQGQDPLFTLVPLDAPVEADVNVNARDIGFIKIGDSVRIKLDAYRYTFHGTAQGVIKSISEGSFTTDDNKMPTEPYFRVRVRVTDTRLRNVPSTFRLIPGMTLTGDIMVGRRTILSYLVEGALRTGSEAMREP